MEITVVAPTVRGFVASKVNNKLISLNISAGRLDVTERFEFGPSRIIPKSAACSVIYVQKKYVDYNI